VAGDSLGGGGSLQPRICAFFIFGRGRTCLVVVISIGLTTGATQIHSDDVGDIDRKV